MSALLLLLLVCTPLAFGTVEPWSIALMEIVAFSLFFLHVGTAGFPLPQSRPARAIMFLFLLFTGLVLLQLLPLPETVLSRVSPAALAIWQKFGGAPPGSLRTASIYPDATRQELLKLLAYAAVFLVVVRHFRTRARITLLVKTILFMAGFLTVIAVAQKLTWNGRILWLFPVEEYLRRDTRIWGPYLNHNHFAFYLEMALPLALGLLLYLAPDTRAAKGVPWGRRLGRFLASDSLAPYAGVFLLALLLAACLISTLSRGAILASAVAALFFAWSTWRRRSLRKKGLQLTLAIAAIVLLVLLPSWDRVEQRFDDIRQKQQFDRLYVLEDSLGIVEDYPVVGTGLGTFEQSYRRYQTKSPRYFFDHAHNDYLELATDTGAAGFLLAGGLAAVFFIALLRGWRQKKSRFGMCIGAGGISSCVALAVHSGTDFNMHIPANALLAAVIAGLTHAAIFSPSGSSERHPAPEAAPPRRPAPRRLLLALGVLPLAALVLYFPVRDLRADYHHRQVARILDDTTTEALDGKPITADTIPDYLRAVASLKRAAALAPSRAAYPQAQADLYATLGDWATSMASLKAPLPAGALAGEQAFALAIAAAERAVSLEPANPDHHLTLAQRYAAVDGDLGRADAQIRLALAAYPVNAPLRYSAATLYLLAGRRTEALEQARELAELDDKFYLFKALEIAWRASGDIDQVKSIAPQNDDARAVVEAFVEWKGLEE